ncbi:MAG TPA: polymer-forming cytoskeletal protein [Pyrinomonadaceae bacterium]|nr:polymer-forming cytoskeletal protein [Pyrinomonadaceae bacterium]
MSTSSDPSVLDGGANGAGATDPFDTGFYFERWMKDLTGGWQQLPPDVAGAPEDSEFYIGSFPGSNCELSFEGVLNFDGYSFGPISSPEGTLVLTQRGRIEADINVRVAVINGWVTGDIIATERVVLDSQAKVMGQIYTPALTVKLGAVFEGECLKIGSQPQKREPESLTEQLSRVEDFLVAAGV